MSARGRGSEVQPSEFYPTPPWCVRRILGELDLPGGRWLEPSAGDGAIIHAVNDVRKDVTWTAIEIREECRAALEPLALTTIGDFTGIYPIPFATPYKVAILNPPFSLAVQFVERLMAYGTTTWIVMLQRTNWLETDERNTFLREFTPDVYVLPNRPSFIGNGTTDATSYAWFVWCNSASGGWRRDYGYIRVLPTTSAEERNEDPRQLRLFGAL